MFSRTTLEFKAKISCFQKAAGAAAVADRNGCPGDLIVIAEADCGVLGIPFFKNSGVESVAEVNFGNIAAGAIITRGQEFMQGAIISQGKGQQDTVGEVFKGIGGFSLATGQLFGRNGGGAAGLVATGTKAQNQEH